MTHGPTTKIDHGIGREENLNKLKNNKISPQVFSGYSGMKVEVNSKTDFRNRHTYFETEQHCFEQWAVEEINREEF